MPQSTTGQPWAHGQPASPLWVCALSQLASGGFVQTLFLFLHTTSAQKGEAG